jgi:DNA-binding MarR family transcriptional regulator
VPKPSSGRSRIHPVIDQTRLLALLGYNLKRASLRLAREYHRPMAKLGLRSAEFATLGLLLDNAGASQKSLGGALAINPPNMATLLDRLEEAGLLQRIRHPHDERARQIQLTPAGRKLALRALEAVDRHEQKALGALTPAERTELMRLLGKLIEAELQPGVKAKADGA